MKRIFFLSTIIISLLCGLSSCRQHDNARKSIAVSLPPQASLLREITGDSIDIVTLMQADANPEAFEVTVKTLRAVSDADLYMKAGNLPFEETLTARISESNPGLRFIDTSDGIRLITGTHSHGNDVHEVADPHTWTSIPNLKTIAANMLAAVNEIDPGHKDYYNASYERLTARLDSAGSAIASRLEGSGSEAFLIWHPSLSYFARDYGLKQIPVGQDNKEMTPGQMRDTHRLAADEGVTVMFIQQNFDSRQAQSLADALGLSVVQINPLDEDYLNQFNIITDALAQ